MGCSLISHFIFPFDMKINAGIIRTRAESAYQGEIDARDENKRNGTAAKRKYIAITRTL